MRAIVYRLQLFFGYKKLNIPELALLLGYSSPQKLYRLFNTQLASPSCQIIEDIATKFNELDLNWLFTGQGSMIKEEASGVNYKEKYMNCLEEKQALYEKIFPKE